MSFIKPADMNPFQALDDLFAASPMAKAFHQSLVSAGGAPPVNLPLKKHTGQVKLGGIISKVKIIKSYQSPGMAQGFAQPQGLSPNLQNQTRGPREITNMKQNNMPASPTMQSPRKNIVQEITSRPDIFSEATCPDNIGKEEDDAELSDNEVEDFVVSTPLKKFKSKSAGLSQKRVKNIPIKGVTSQSRNVMVIRNEDDTDKSAVAKPKNKQSGDGKDEMGQIRKERLKRGRQSLKNTGTDSDENLMPPKSRRKMEGEKDAVWRQQDGGEGSMEEEGADKSSQEDCQKRENEGSANDSESEISNQVSGVGNSQSEDQETLTELLKNQVAVDRMGPVEIDQWVIQACPRGICVEGHRLQDQKGTFWHSSAIIKRVSQNVIETGSGAQYKLVGNIDAEECKIKGIPKTLVKSFYDGFPWNWEELIKKLKPDIEVKNSRESKPVAAKKDSRENKMETPKRKSSTENKKKKYEKKRQSITDKKKPGILRSSSLHATSKTKKLKGKATKARNKSQPADTQDVLDLESLPRTRSGRIVKPQLAWWATQRVCYNERDDLVEIRMETPPHQLKGTQFIQFREDKRKQQILNRSNQSILEKSIRRRRSKLNSSVDDTLSVATESELESTVNSSNLGTSTVTTPTTHTSRSAIPDLSTPVSTNALKTYNTTSDMPLDDTLTIEDLDPKSEPFRKVGKKKAKGNLIASDSEKETSKTDISKRNDTETETEKEVSVKRTRVRGRKIKVKDQNEERAEIATKITSNSKKTVEKLPPKNLRNKDKLESREKGLESGGINIDCQGETDQDVYADDEHSQTDSMDLESPGQREDNMTVLKKRKSNRLSAKGLKTATAKNNIKTADAEVEEDVLSLFSEDYEDEKLDKQSHKVKVKTCTSSMDEDTEDDILSQDYNQDQTKSKKMLSKAACPTSKKQKKGLHSKQTLELKRNEKGCLLRKDGSGKEIAIPSKKSAKKVEKPTKKSEIVKNKRKTATVLKETSSEGEEEDTNIMKKPAQKKSAIVKSEIVKNKRKTATVLKETSSEGEEEDTNIIKKPAQKKSAIVKSEIVKNKRKTATVLKETSSEGEEEDTNIMKKPAQKKSAIVKSGIVKNKRKTATVLKETSSEGEEEDINIIKKPAQKKSVIVKRKNKLNVIQEHDDEDSHSWTVEEMKTLRSAMSKVDATTPLYWEKVATFMDSRTGEQCQQCFQQGAPPSIKKKTKPQIQKEKVTVPEQITGGKGTMKRNRQLRELVDNFNQNYEDDYFDSTPSKQAQGIRMPNLAADDSFEEFFKNRVNFETPGSSRLRTPSAQYSWMPSAHKATPVVGNFFSPGLLRSVDRKAMDGYIHKLKKQRRGRPLMGTGARKTISSTVVTQSDNKSSQAKAKEVDPPQDLFMVSQAPEEDDSEEEKDYYFTDEEEN